jgi:spore germination protein KC
MQIRLHKTLLALIAISSCVSLSGCWDSDDIDGRAVVLAIAIDKAKGHEELNIPHSQRGMDKPKQSLIRLTAQIAVPGRIPLGPQTGGGGGSGQKPVWVVSVNGHTIDEAIINLQQEVADEIFLGHLRVIVVSEDLARQGVNRFTDYLKRNSQVRRTAWLVVSDKEAGKFMEFAPKLEQVPGLYLAAVLEDAIDLGKVPTLFIGRIWSMISSNAQDGAVPYLSLKNKENVQIKGLAKFNGDRMVGTVDPAGIGVYMGIIGEHKGGYGVFENSPELNGTVLIRAIHRDAKIKTSFRNGHPHVRVIFHYEAELEEVEVDQNRRQVINPEILKSLEDRFSRGIEKEAITLIEEGQKEKSDIFGFGEHFRAKHPKYWKQHVNRLGNWHKEFGKMTYDIECHTNIRQIGMKAK